MLRLLRSGHEDGGISEALSLSPVTVRRHISAGVAKLGVADRDAAVPRARHDRGRLSRTAAA